MSHQTLKQQAILAQFGGVKPSDAGHLRRLIRDCGHTVKSFSEHHEISYEALKSLINGKRKGARATVGELASLLGLDIQTGTEGAGGGEEWPESIRLSSRCAEILMRNEVLILGVDNRVNPPTIYIAPCRFTSQLPGVEMWHDHISHEHGMTCLFEGCQLRWIEMASTGRPS